MKLQWYHNPAGFWEGYIYRFPGIRLGETNKKFSNAEFRVCIVSQATRGVWDVLPAAHALSGYSARVVSKKLAAATRNKKFKSAAAAKKFANSKAVKILR